MNDLSVILSIIASILAITASIFAISRGSKGRQNQNSSNKPTNNKNQSEEGNSCGLALLVLLIPMLCYISALVAYDINYITNEDLATISVVCLIFLYMGFVFLRERGSRTRTYLCL